MLLCLSLAHFDAVSPIFLTPSSLAANSFQAVVTGRQITNSACPVAAAGRKSQRHAGLIVARWRSSCCR
jgi:hypothetical protein